MTGTLPAGYQDERDAGEEGCKHDAPRKSRDLWSFGTVNIGSENIEEPCCTANTPLINIADIKQSKQRDALAQQKKNDGYRAKHEKSAVSMSLRTLAGDSDPQRKPDR